MTTDMTASASKRPWTDMRQFLLKYKDRHITYVPNEGNGGDSVIAFATLQLFDELGLNYTLSRAETFKDQLVFYGGGGNLNSIWNAARIFLERNHKHNEIVVLPHTFAFAGPYKKELIGLLSKFDTNVTLIGRDGFSSVAFKYFCGSANTCFSHDMAFYITNMDQYKNKATKPVGYMMRTDAEGVRWRPPPGDNHDISAELQDDHFTNIFTRDGVEHATHQMFECISQYETIHTNRLHVAIVGALCGNNVMFYNNCYWKNWAINNASFKPLNYTNVKFTSTPPWEFRVPRDGSGENIVDPIREMLK